MNRTFLTASAVLRVLGLTTACGGGSDAGEGTSSTGPIKVWLSNNPEEIAWGEAMVKEWNAEHSDQKITAQEIPAGGGQLLFDPKRPTEILARMNYPWLEPSTFEDQHGLVSNVTFVGGPVHLEGTWFAHYGQSDSTLGAATYKVGATYPGLV